MKDEIKQIVVNLLNEKLITPDFVAEILKPTKKEEVIKMLTNLWQTGKVSGDSIFTLIEYVVHYKEELPLHLPGTQPVLPYSFPTYPSNPGSTDPYPWQLPQVYCYGNATTTNIPSVERMSYQINS